MRAVFGAGVFSNDIQCNLQVLESTGIVNALQVIMKVTLYHSLIGGQVI